MYVSIYQVNPTSDMIIIKNDGEKKIFPQNTFIFYLPFKTAMAKAV